MNSQQEISLLKEWIHQTTKDAIVISGKSGSGVTHLLNAICNESKGLNTVYITAEWLLQLNKINKHAQQLKSLVNQFLKQDIIAIDNIQLIYNKSKASCLLFYELIKSAKLQNKQIILGCSNIEKDISKRKHFLTEFNFKRIELKELSSSDMFVLLKNLCTIEDAIPESLIYKISNFNGTVQQHINCLISVRFKSKSLGLNLKTLNESEFDIHFNLSSYFPKQQFRKHFIQCEFDFNTLPHSHKQILKI
jgi:chromosomal replication initiation ATPase DnaA